MKPVSKIGRKEGMEGGTEGRKKGGGGKEEGMEGGRKRRKKGGGGKREGIALP